MDKTGNQHMPRARHEDLLVHELADEVLVYDLKRQKAHCLNETSALVWNRCDGLASVADIAGLLGEKLGTAVDENVVWLALKQLDNAHLLREASPLPADRFSISRRQLMKRLGWSAAAALPLITSILAPKSASAQSCLAQNAPCVGSPTPCCPGCNCDAGSGQCVGSC